MKTVKFDCDSLTVYTMYAWNFAYRNARRGHWEQIEHTDRASPLENG